MIRAATLTVSTSKAAGKGVDEGGPALARFIDDLGLELVAAEIVPDDRSAIERRLIHFADELRCTLVLTTGGTGFSPDDVTPEATRAVIDRETPGIGEAMRIASRPHTDKWMLSRSASGIRGRTLIINFPGNPPSIAQIGGELAPAMEHAFELLAR